MPYEEETALTHHKEQGPPGGYPFRLGQFDGKGSKNGPCGNGGHKELRMPRA